MPWWIPGAGAALPLTVQEYKPPFKDGQCPLHCENLFAGWCSSCDAEIVWALQRPHLVML